MGDVKIIYSTPWSGPLFPKPKPYTNCVKNDFITSTYLHMVHIFNTRVSYINALCLNLLKQW